MLKRIALLGLAMIAINLQVALSQNASFTIDQGTTICVNECITITDNSTSTVNINAWAWSITGPIPIPSIPDPGAQDPTPEINGNQTAICFSETGTYLIELQITDANGNVANANTQVNVVVCPGSINAGFIGPSSVCLGDCIALRDTSEGVPVNWQWDINALAGVNAVFLPDGLTQSNLQNPEICFYSITGTDPITIELTVTNADGKVSKATKQVNVVEIPTVTASLDTIVELGNPAIIGATQTGASKFRWEPSETVVNPKSLTTFAYPVETTDYVITVEDGNGCAASDTVKIYLNFIPNIGVPSAFSPNGDGKNDLLVVKGLGLTKCIFKVHNRYGIGIYESTVQKNGWDGNIKGKPATPGVYYWTLEYEFISGKSGTLSGNTTLVR
ncbi:MAG: gliding motility-associated C-terminal domain-containing protein [Crocinitomicaceae bacterium]